MSDQKNLIEQLIKRDEPAIRQTLEEINPYLIKILASNRVKPESIEELLQATWETFFKNIDKFEGRSRLKVFVAGIALNKLREFRRTEARFAPEEDMDKILSDAFTDDGWWKVKPVLPDQILSSKNIGLYIEECLKGLSENQRYVFVMREVEDEPTDNICQTLGVSISNFGVLLFRAKEKLRYCLEGRGVSE